jgi:hypothetical protein
VATPLEIGGSRFIDVTDPESEQTFRFYEVEYSVACAMDGNRDVEGLVRWSKQELGLEPSQDELEMVINTLSDLGYLTPTGDLDDGDGLELGHAGPVGSSPHPAPAAPDVELGSSGASAIAKPRPAPPDAADLELGSPGKSAPANAPGKVTMGWDSPPVDPAEFERLIGSDLGPAGNAPSDSDLPPPPAAAAPPPVPSLTPSGRPDSDSDGPTQIPEAAPPDDDDDDVSVDLSDHLSIGTDDVKEAVRQSKVMHAVEIPADLKAALDDDAATPPEPKEPKPKAKTTPDAKTKPAPKADRQVELPAKPVKVTDADEPKAAAASEAPQPAAGGGGGMVIVLLLILALAAAGGGYWYFKIYKQDDTSRGSNKSGQTSGDSGKGTPAKPAGPATAKLAVADEDVVEVLAIDSGVIAMIAVEGDEVDEGAVVASLKGVESVERSLTRPRRKLAEYSAKLEEVKQKGATDKLIAMYQAKVDEKQGLVDEGEAKLAALQMLAPMPGKVKPRVEAGDKVEKDDPVADVLGAPGLTATFPATKPYEIGADCQIARADEAAKTAPCKVDGLEGKTVTVRVSQDSGFAAGDVVVLQ